MNENNRCDTLTTVGNTWKQLKRTEKIKWQLRKETNDQIKQIKTRKSTEWMNKCEQNANKIK